MLYEWLKKDWGMFTLHKMNLPTANMLLAEIFNDGEIVRKKFSPTKTSGTDRINVWNRFKDELKRINRFFPENKLENLLSGLMEELKIDPKSVSKLWYRARVQRGNNPLTKNEMGAPPPEKAQQGRANPTGIPYLYLASNKDTAISEIRPHTGDNAFVAEVSINDSLDVIDLRDPRKTISPFDINGKKDIASLRGDIEFLVHLGEELKRPVLPHSAEIDYLPTQYICELIKKNQYHGVLYNSSVGEGFNLALFDPTHGIIGDIKQHKVSRVEIKWED